MTVQQDRVLQLARISSEMLALPQERAALRSIVTKATEFVPGCTAAAITQHARSRLGLVTATDPVARTAEELQLELGDGPTLDAGQRTDRCCVIEFASEARWPTWAARMSALGLTAMISLILSAGSEQLGVLSLSTVCLGGFDPEAISMAEAFGMHASVALFAAKQSSALEGAVEAKHRIGIAQGILASRYSIDKDAAFALLRRYSNTTNTKLRDVAVMVYELGDLPPTFRPAPPGPRGSTGPLVRQRRQGPS